MNKTDIMEIKKRFKKNETTITKFYSFYVDGEGEISFFRKDNLLKLRDDCEEDFHKFLDMQKKLLSGKSYDLDFNGEDSSEVKKILNVLKEELKDEEVLKVLAESIKEAYLKDNMSRALITFAIDTYDIPEKTTDGIKTGESDEVYTYIMCSVCPVTLSKAGLSVYESSKEIKARILDSIVSPPEIGFVFPSFTDRSSDDSTITIFSKNKTKTWDNFVCDFLKCEPIVIESEQKDVEQQNIEEIVVNSEVSYSSEVVRKTEFNEDNLCVEEERKEESLSFDTDKEVVKMDEEVLEEDNISTKDNSLDNFSLEDDNSSDDLNDINGDIKEEENKEEDTIDNLTEDNLNKFLEKINNLLDNKEATYQIIDGKKYLLIPME